jgi:hypothetical protein
MPFYPGILVSPTNTKKKDRIHIITEIDAELLPLTHVTAHLPGLVQALQ